MLNRIFACRLSYLCIIVAILLPYQSYGDEITRDPGTQLLEDYQLKKEQEELFNQPNQLLPQYKKPTIAPKQNEQCFVINKITISGTKLINSQQQSQIFSSHIGKCIGGSGINQLLIDINSWLIEQGYVTSRAYVKPQNIKEGNLEFLVIEGKLEELKLKEQEKYLQNSSKLLTAFPNLTSKTFNIRDIEQGLDQMNRLASQQATVKLIPGTKPATSILEIDNKISNPYRIYAGFDNKGEDTTGKYRSSLIFEADNLLGLSDSTTLNIAETRRSRAYSWHFNIPYGYSTISYSGSYSNYKTTVKDKVSTSGSGRNHEISFDHLLYRDSKHKFSFNSALALKDSDRFIKFDQIKIKSQPQPMTVAKVGLSHFYRGNSYILSSKLNISQGIAAFGAAKDPKGINKDDLHNQFTKFSGSINLYKPLTKNVSYLGTAHAQYSRVGLQSSETLSIADNNYVRGASALHINADDGLVIRNEFSFNLPDNFTAKLPLQKFQPQLKPYIFIDIGYGKAKAEKQFNKIASVGTGLNFQLHRFSGGLSLAKPIYKSQNIRKKTGWEVMFNTTIKLY